MVQNGAVKTMRPFVQVERILNKTRRLGIDEAAQLNGAGIVERRG